MRISSLFTRLAAVGVVGFSAWYYFLGDQKTILQDPVPSPTADHVDTSKRKIALSGAVTSFDELRTEAKGLEAFAKDMGLENSYQEMLRELAKVDDALISHNTRMNVPTAQDKIASVEGYLQAVFVIQSDNAITPLIIEAMRDPAKLTIMTAKHKNAGDFIKKWQTSSQQAKNASGVATPDITENNKFYLNNPMTRDLALALLPIKYASGVLQQTLTMNMAMDVAQEMKRQGAAWDHAGGLETLRKRMEEQAPDSDISRLRHAHGIAYSFVMSHADMQKDRHTFNLAVANVSGKYTDNIITTFNQTLTTAKKTCITLQNELAKHNIIPPKCEPMQ